MSNHCARAMKSANYWMYLVLRLTQCREHHRHHHTPWRANSSLAIERRSRERERERESARHVDTSIIQAETAFRWSTAHLPTPDRTAARTDGNRPLHRRRCDGGRRDLDLSSSVVNTYSGFGTGPDGSVRVLIRTMDEQARSWAGRRVWLAATGFRR
ncbi:hypothetical protein BJX64DRAFT_230524 [Aspergillus heterothallicus]